MANENPTEKTEELVPAVFLTEISCLGGELKLVIEQLKHLPTMDDEAIAGLHMLKQRLKAQIFAKLAHAYQQTNGEVCEWPYFNPQYTRAYIDLHLPYSGYALWAKVVKWMEEQEEERRYDENEGFYDDIRIETSDRAKNSTQFPGDKKEN